MSHNEEFLSLIEENEETIAKYDHNIKELKEKNEELKEDNKFYQEKLLDYNNLFELQNKKLIDLEEEIDNGQNLIQFQNNEFKKKELEVLLLNQRNEDLQNEINLLLSQINQKKDKFSISNMTHIQINNCEKQKELCLKSNIFFYSINEVELELERDISAGGYYYNNLEIFSNSNKKNCTKTLHDELKNCFVDVNNLTKIEPTKSLFEDNFGYEIEVNENNFEKKEFKEGECQTHQNDFKEKKFQSIATQTELEKEIEESLILSVIKKNKKLFLSLGSISLIAALFYLKKEKLIYWYGFLPKISCVF